MRGKGRSPLTYPGPQHMLGCGGLKLSPGQGNSSPGVSGLLRKACLRLRPLTSVLGHNAQSVPGTLARGLLGAGFGAGSPCPLVLWGWGGSCCPLGLNIVPSVMGLQCSAASLASPFPLLIHSFIQHSGPSPCWGMSQPPAFPLRLAARL